MRRSIQVAVVAVIVLLLGTSAALFQRYRKVSADYVESKTAEETARSHYADAFNAIAEIQDSLNAISPADGAVRLRSGSLSAEQKLTEPSRSEALESIALLNASIQRTKEKITLLESSLKKSGMRIAGLQKMLASVKQTVIEKEGLIAELSGRVDSLQTQVTGLVTQVDDNRVTIEEKRRELATIYVAVGSKRELASKGVIVAKGGVLGLGKTLQPSGVASETAFTPLDTDHETIVPVSSAKARVLSAQPPSSYELTLVDGRMELHILDPREFRKVRQLVILTA